MSFNKASKYKSLKSVRTISQVNKTTEQVGTAKDTSFELETFLPEACARMEVSEDIIVLKEYQRDDNLNKSTARKNVKINAMESFTPVMKPEVDNIKTNDKKNETNKIVYDINTCVVNLIYDELDRLVAISFDHMAVIPRKLLQLLTGWSSFFPKLQKISITLSKIKVYTVFELQKFLMASNITEICLDYSPLSESNYYLLLDEASNLKNLSLAGCRINDEVCRIIAGKLTNGSPAEKTLCLLNLTNNEITDIGAASIAVMLRTNRCLRYLNVSGNGITDEGAARIFSALKEFPLTDDEVYEKRKRYLAYLKKRQEMINKILSEYEDETVAETARKGKTKKASKSSGARSRMQADDFSLRASIMAEDLIGPFEDPFSDRWVQRKENILYCVGNVSLCYLNLSYNDLSYLCLKELQSVLTHQTWTKKPDQVGLLKVVLDGNKLPGKCQELDTISNLLSRAVNLRNPKEYGARRKSIAKTPRAP